MRHSWTAYSGPTCVGVGTVEAPTEREALEAVLSGRAAGQFSPRPDAWYRIRVGSQVASGQGAELGRVAQSSSLPDDGAIGAASDRDVAAEARRLLQDHVLTDARKAELALAGPREEAAESDDPMERIIRGARTPKACPHPGLGIYDPATRRTTCNDCKQEIDFTPWATCGHVNRQVTVSLDGRTAHESCADCGAQVGPGVRTSDHGPSGHTFVGQECLSHLSNDVVRRVFQKIGLQRLQDLTEVRYDPANRWYEFSFYQESSSGYEHRRVRVSDHEIASL